MISRPNTVYPNNQALDASTNNTFTFQFIGDTMSAYQIKVVDSTSYSAIYTGAKKNEVAYNGDTVSAAIPAASFKNGIDLLWMITIWQENPTILIVNGVVQSGSTTTTIKIRQHPQLKINMYLKIGTETRKITAYDLKTGTATVSLAFTSSPAANTTYSIMSDFVESAYFFFWTRKIPVLTIPEIGIVNTRKLNVIPIYQQEQNIPIKYQRYVLTSLSGEVINDTGQLSTSNLEYKFDGLVSGESYILNWGVITQDDMTAETSKTFSVNYAPPRIDFLPKLTFVPEKNAVLVQWFKDLQSIGNATGGSEGEGWEIVTEFPFSGTNSVRILKGNIVFDKINGNPIGQFEKNNQYFNAISTVLNAGFQGKIIGVSNGIFEHYIAVKQGDLVQVTRDNIETKIGELFPRKDTAIQQFLSYYRDDTFYYVPENVTVPDGWYFIESGSEMYQNNYFKIELVKENEDYSASVKRIPIV